MIRDLATTLAVEHIILIAAGVLIAGIAASKASERFGVPALLLFLILGMLAGADGPGRIYFDNAALAQGLGIVALSFILFAGGVETEWQAIRPVMAGGIILATLGVVTTTVVVAGFAVFALGFSWLEALLLASIVSSTDAAAVFSVLRSRNANFKGQLRPLLELESGSNDPMAVFLTVGFITLLTNPGTSAAALVPMFLLQFTLGLAAGFAMGRITVAVINRLKLEYQGLYPVFTIGMVLLTYGMTSAIGGSGFLAVYILGLVMGNANFVHKKSLVRFHDGLAWLMQIGMFLTLGLLVFPTRLIGVAGAGILLSLILMFAARPIGVFLSLALGKFTCREKLMVSWVGLRGAVPIVLATFPLLAGLEASPRIFNLVFFIVITSTIVQAPSIPWVARLLKLDAPLPTKRPLALDFEGAGAPDLDLVEFVVPFDSPAAGTPIVSLKLPKETLIVLIVREESFLMATGDTVLEAGDVIQVLASKASLGAFQKAISGF